MSHLARVGLLLALFIVSFLFLRAMSANVSIDFIGLTHGDNPREWASLSIVNQPSADCAECHETINASWSISDHVTVTCENCHGGTKEHIELASSDLEAPLAISDARDLCFFCHAELDARPPDFPQVEVATHSAPEDGQAAPCASCHNPHQPGIPPAILHDVEIPPRCLGCHGKDEWVPVSDAHLEPNNAECLTCHKPKEEE